MIPVIDFRFFFIGFIICHEKAWRKDFRPATLNGNAVERFHFFRLLNSIIPLGLANILLKQLNSITFFLLISIAGLFWTIYYPSNCHSYCKMAHIWYSTLNEVWPIIVRAVTAWNHNEKFCPLVLFIGRTIRCPHLNFISIGTLCVTSSSNRE